MSAESRSLADVIKGTHRELRKAYKLERDDESVWMRHCQNEHVLKSYAHSMHVLATKHWEKLSSSNPHTSRITWSYQTILDYFQGGGLEKARKKWGKEAQGSPFDDQSKMKLLDVGSCYNPFACYEDLDVMAVDLCPAVDSVYQCDFLTVPIQQDMVIDEGKVISLKRNHFQCVIFSFLLEYLPSPAQRWACCCKAQKVLTDEGLLLIITPDSKAAHSNAKVMKSWREAIETIGFKRIKYEKLQHAHCMAFRKNDNVEPEDIEAQDVSAKMYIPQDHQNFSDSDDDDDCYIRYTEEELLEGFSELPKFCSDL
uniref:S-adenosylmethionine sensor upstream of mTORC1 n=1 Tax=Moina brachiata TaxID=675436 RepID=A0A4Y7NJI3_9CRUS|nr:EOG090X0FUY [Moina brachiata]